MKSNITDQETIKRREKRREEYRHSYDRLLDLLKDHPWNEAVRLLKEEQYAECHDEYYRTKCDEKN